MIIKWNIYVHIQIVVGEEREPVDAEPSVAKDTTRRICGGACAISSRSYTFRSPLLDMCTSNISLCFRLLLLLSSFPANAKILRVQLNSKWRVFPIVNSAYFFSPLSPPPSHHHPSIPILRRRFPSASLPSSTSVTCF